MRYLVLYQTLQEQTGIIEPIISAFALRIIDYSIYDKKKQQNMQPSGTRQVYKQDIYRPFVISITMYMDCLQNKENFVRYTIFSYCFSFTFRYFMLLNHSSILALFML